VTESDTHRQIELPGKNRLLSEFASDLGNGLSKANVFRLGETAVIPNEFGDGLQQLDCETFRSWAEQHVVCVRSERAGDDSTRVKIRQTMSRADAFGALMAPQFLKNIRIIERINQVRLPVLRKSGWIELLPDGYDLESRTFTTKSDVAVVDRQPIADAKRFLDEILEEFPFADSGRSKSVHIAAMLTLFGASLLPKHALRPCFIYLANAEGAGKTLLVKTATVPVLGFAPTNTVPKDEDEMRKILFTATFEAKPVVFFDNYKGHLSSESLEGFLSSQRWSGRILGSSKSFTGDNLATVFITGNGCTVSPDRKFTNPLEVGTLLSDRNLILTALMSLVRHWQDAMEPEPSRTNASFPEWSTIIGGIVENAGYGCPLETPTIDAAADQRGSDIRTLVRNLGESESKLFSFESLIGTARELGLFEDLIGDESHQDRSVKAKFANLLKSYDRRLIAGFRFVLEGKGRNRRYKCENPTL
jgi:hypothetical protein